MSAASAARSFEVRHLQLARALFAAIAAIMITFSRDHSALVGMSVFSGYATATAMVFFLGAWLVYPSGRRATPVLLGVVALVAGILGGVPTLRTTVAFFVVVISWAALSGLIELIAGIRHRKADDATTRLAARDEILVGALGLALAAGLLLVNPAYALDYVIEEAGSFTLTGITIGVGLYGGYAAVVAVFLGIAGFSPRRDEPVDAAAVCADDRAPADPSPTATNPEVAS